MKKFISMLICALILVSSVSVCFAEAAQYDNHDIIKEVAYAYHRQGGQIHYDQTINRRHLEASPEDATSQKTVFLDCSSFVNSCYFEAFGVDVLPTSHINISPVTEKWDNYAKENQGKADVFGYWENDNFTTDEEKTEICEYIKENLEIGDVLTYRRINPKTNGTNGHTMIYVGDGYFLHCTGSDMYAYLGSTPEKSYDRSFSEEVSGAVLLMPISDVLDKNDGSRYLFYETETHKKTSFSVLRPLKRNLTPTEETLNRMKIAGLTMEKTSSVYENSAVYTGDVIVYTISVCNTTTENKTGVTLTDAVPFGTEFVSGSDGVELADGIISWKGDIAAGKTVNLRYSVRVTESAPGAVIINNKTTVGGVLLGDIRHTVSGFDKSENLKISKTAKEFIKENKAFDSSIDMVNELYNKALGLKIFDEETVTDVLGEVTDAKEHTLRNDTELSKMAVPNLFGGCDLTTSALVITDNNATRLVSEDELSVGDIIVGDIFPAGIWKGNFAGDICYVYIGNSTLMALEDGKVKALTIGLDIYGNDADNILVTLIAYNRFAVIRPSMMYPESKSIFADVNEGAWYYDAVKYVKDNALINKLYANVFAPDEDMTRLALVKALYRLSGSPETEIVNFDDVSGYFSAHVGPDETQRAISWAVNNGIATGISETLFAPEESLTREQMATFLYRFAKYNNKLEDKDTDLSSYKDKDAISDYAKDAFSYAVAQKIISGVAEDTLSPKGTLTRAQAAAMLQRIK